MIEEARHAASQRSRAALRTLLSADLTSGLSVALGLLLVSGGVHLWLGAAAGAAAATGAIVASPPDRPGPRRGKLRQMLPAPLLGIPLFLAAQLLVQAPWRLGLLVVPATFLAFLAMAWGKRGIAISIAVMLALVFSLAMPAPADVREALERAAHMALGALLYVVYATLANLLLNGRYRVQATAELLLSVATLMRTQARQFTARDEASDVREVAQPLLGELLRAQAALADQLQATRDIVFESPRTASRQRLAGLLLTVLEMRDHLLASELDLESLQAHPRQAPALSAMRGVLEGLARDVAHLADELLTWRSPTPIADRQASLDAIGTVPPVADLPAPDPIGPSHAMLARGLANRLTHLNDETVRLAALARGDQAPDLAVVRAHWQLFVSPTDWSLAPFLALWHWDAPPLRHALRAALAVGTGYLLAVAMPWGSHEYWILLTIVVVLRGSLAQTLERRNQRVAGTLAGSVLVVLLLSAHPGPLGLLLALTLGQAVAHGFAIRNYTVTAVGATVLGLVQAHMLYMGAKPTFALGERIGDTLIGAGLAWAFCYVLPSWERRQIPALVSRTLASQARHARLALGLGHLTAVDTRPELEWRLARREVFDALSALVQATQRSLSEPRAVRPPLEPLERLQAHSYQLLAQLSAVKSMLLLRRDRLDTGAVEAPLSRAAVRIDALLAPRAMPAELAGEDGPVASLPAGPIALPDPNAQDITPWLLRRLDLAVGLATQLREDAARILQQTAEAPAGSLRPPQAPAA